MVRWIILACVVVVLTVAGTLAIVYSPDPSIEPAIALHKGDELPPKLVLVGPPEFNFGTMPKRTDGAHSWELKNVGAGVLDLWLEETSCSCTIAKLADEKSTGAGGAKKTVKVPPGKSTPIEVSWETRDWSNFGQTVTLGTNDPEKSTITLIVKGKVLLPVAVEPSNTVSFANVSNEETHRASITILSPDQAGLKLTKVVSSKPGLIVAEVMPMTPEQLDTLKVKSGYTMAIAVKPGMPLGSFREELLIQTDHPNQSEVKVTVAGKMTGPITVFPEKLEMFNVASRQGDPFRGGPCAGDGEGGHRSGRLRAHEGPISHDRHRALRYPGRFRRRSDRPEDRPPPGQRGQDPGEHLHLAIGRRLSRSGRYDAGSSATMPRPPVRLIYSPMCWEAKTPCGHWSQRLRLWRGVAATRHCVFCALCTRSVRRGGASRMGLTRRMLAWDRWVMPALWKKPSGEREG
jgi:hypothetical protein